MATLTNSVRSNDLIASLGGAAPSAGDTVLLAAYQDDYTANTDLGTNSLALLHARAGWGGSIDAGSLKFTATTGAARFEHAGRVLRFDASSGAAVLRDVTWAPSGNGLGIFSSGVITNLFAAKGTLLAAGVVTNGYFTGGSHELRANATAATLIENAGATLLVQRDTATFNQSAGTTVIDDTSFTPGTTNARGGVVQYLRCGASGGTLNAYGGVLDFSRCSANVTFAGGVLHPGATLIIPSGVTIDYSACTNYGVQVRSA